MRQIIEQRIAQLAAEIQSLHNEREALARRDDEIQTRIHQVVGAINEFQQLIADLDRLPVVPGEVVELPLTPQE